MVYRAVKFSLIDTYIYIYYLMHCFGLSKWDIAFSLEAWKIFTLVGKCLLA